MKLTLIPSKTKKNFFKIFRDDEFLGAVPKKLIPADFFLSSFQEHDITHNNPSPNNMERGEIKDNNPEITQFCNTIKEWVIKKANELLLNYLAKMEHTVFDCRNYMKKCGIPKATIDMVINDAIARKWLSDERYADLYAEESVFLKRSPLDVKFKLRQKKIDPIIVNRIINKHFDNDTKREIIIEHINKMMDIHTNLTPQKRFEKIATTLYRKGFQYSDYDDILRDFCSKDSI